MNKTEKIYWEDFVKPDMGPLSYSRATLAAAANTDYAERLVLGTISATGKKVPYNPTANNGSEIADSVLKTHVLAQSAAGDVAVEVLDALALIDIDFLVWGANVTTDAQKATAIASLRSNIIKKAEVYNA